MLSVNGSFFYRIYAADPGSDYVYVYGRSGCDCIWGAIFKILYLELSLLWDVINNNDHSAEHEKSKDSFGSVRSVVSYKYRR